MYACGRNSQSDYLCVGRTGYVIAPVKVLLNDKIADIAATYSWSSGIWQSLFAATSKVGELYFKWGDDTETDGPKTVDTAYSLLDVFANFKTPQSLGEMIPTDVITLLDKVNPDKKSEDTLPNKSILDKWLIFDVLDNEIITKIKYVYAGGYFIPAFSQFSLGAFIITNNDEVYSWGSNGLPQRFLGYKSDEKITKVEILTGKNIRKIVIKLLGGIALTTDGRLYVWNTSSEPQVEKNLIGKTVVDFSCGEQFYVYILENAEAYILTSDFSEVIHRKISVPESEKILSLECGTRHILALTNESNVYTFAFGDGPYGTLGDEREKYDESPLRRLKINSPGPCKKIMAGLTSSFFLTNTGELYEMEYRYYFDVPWLKWERVVYEPKKVLVDDKIEDIAGTTHFGYALKTVSGKIFKWRKIEMPEEIQEADFLVEAFAEKEIPQSLPMVRLSSFKSALDDEHTTHSDLSLSARRACHPESNLFSDPLYSDVTILLNDGVIPGHKILLHTKSAFFRNALSSSKTVNRNELDLSSYNPNAVRAILKYIYDLPIGQRATSLGDVFDFRKLAMEDGNQDLIAEADEILLKNMTFKKR